MNCALRWVSPTSRIVFLTPKQPLEPRKNGDYVTMLQLGGKIRNFCNFPWNGHYLYNVDRSVCTQPISKVIVYREDSYPYVPDNFPALHDMIKKPWFKHDCSRSIKDIEGVYKRHKGHKTLLHFCSKSHSLLSDIPETFSSVDNVKTLLIQIPLKLASG